MAPKVLVFMSSTIYDHVKILVEPRTPNKSSEDPPGEQNIKEDKIVNLLYVPNAHFSARSNRKVYFLKWHQSFTYIFWSSNSQHVDQDPLGSNDSSIGDD